MRRRDFLLASGAGALAALPGARANLVRRRTRLVVVFASGGWDTTYAVDPKEPDRVDVPAGRVARFEGLEVFVDDSRPAITRFFERHAASTTLVRGIAVDAINHLECQRRIATGTREETRPDLGAMVAHDAGNDLPIPYLILGRIAFPGPYAVSAARVGGRNQLVELIDPSEPPVTGKARAAGDERRETELLRAYADASAARARATRGATGYNRRRVDDFVQALDRADNLKALRARLGRRDEALTYDGQIALAVDALERDLSHAVAIDPRLDFDTHTDNAAQGRMQDALFGGLDRLVGELARRPGREAGTRMIDDTLVVCVSELARTPRLNAAEQPGKEHWPFTAAVLVGAGVRGGRVVGATAPDQVALSVDLATGAADPAGTRMLHTHFIAGVLRACGVDPAAHFPAHPVLDALVA